MRQNAHKDSYQATTCDGCGAESHGGTGFPRFDLGGSGGAYLCRTCWGKENKGRAVKRPWAGMVAFPEPLRSHVLRYRWSVSRSDGYNVITISEGGTRYATARGGGYDMTGAALADWLTARYPVRMAQLAEGRAASIYSKNGNTHSDHSAEGKLYGLVYLADSHKASLDGACGVSSVCKVLEALGLRFTEDNGNFSKRTGRRKDEGVFFVAPPAEA